MKTLHTVVVSLVAGLAVFGASPSSAQHDPVNLRCGDDLLQTEMEKRKVAFRGWARGENRRQDYDPQNPDNMERLRLAVANGAAFVGYMSSNHQLKLPWTSSPTTNRTLNDVRLAGYLTESANNRAWLSLRDAVLLKGDQDMGLNSWIRVLYLHRDNPALTAPLREDLEFTFRQFQYWIDEPLNTPADVGAQRTEQEQIFWSENHYIMYATLELLAGQFFADKPFRDGRTGRQHRDKAVPRLQRWLDERLRFGFSEWNSPGYYEYDIMPLLNLVDFAEDPAIARRAAMVLDLLFFDLARFTQRGSFGVTAGRVYGNQKSSGWTQSVGDVIEILFGTRGAWTWGDSPSAHALATTTKYCVPSVLLAIGRHQPERLTDRSRVSMNPGEPGAPGTGTDDEILSWWTRGAYYLGTEMAIRTNKLIEKWHLPPGLGQPEAKYAPHLIPLGHMHQFFFGTALTRANLYTYRDAGAMLSSVQQFRPGQVGPQMNPWQVTVDTDVTVWGTYPWAGFDPLENVPKTDPIAEPSGDGPNWWTGNWVIPFVVQNESALIAVYAPAPNGPQAIAGGHRTHLWFPVGPNAFSPTDEAQKEQVKGFVNFKPGFDSRSGRFDASKMFRRSDGPTWIFGLKRREDGESYVGIFSAQKCYMATQGLWANKEIECPGLRNVFIVQVGSNKTFGSFDNFVSACRNARIHISKGFTQPMNPFVDVQVSYDSPDPIVSRFGNHRLEVHYTKGEARYGGQRMDLQNFPRFQNPYVTAGWGAPGYTISHDGFTLSHNRETNSREGTGLYASSLVAPFPNRIPFEGELYGVTPAGEVIWRRHVFMIDRSPAPESNAPWIAYQEKHGGGSTKDDKLEQARNPTTAVAEAMQAKRQLRNVQIQQQHTPIGGGALRAATALADRPPVAGTLDPTKPPPPPPPREATLPAHISHYWMGPTPVNSGWESYREIIPASNSELGPSFYALTKDGVLKWYLHEGAKDGTPRWRGPIDVHTNWNDCARTVAAGNGVLYCIRPDGAVIWHKHSDAANASTQPRWAEPKMVHTGWDRFVHVFSTEQGVIYTVTADGSLYWNMHVGYRNGEAQWLGPTHVSSRWAGAKRVFSPAAGVIYIVKSNGELVWLVHEGYLTGATKWVGPATISEGWGDFVHVFPSKWGRHVSDAIN